MPSGSGYFATNYIADTSLFDTRFRRFWFGAMWLAIILFPFFASSYLLHLINLVALACIGALALNMLTGCAGLISLGQAAFLCVGGFSAVIFGLQFNLPWWLVLILAPVCGAMAGVIAGLPSLRVRGLYLALSTLAIYYIVFYLGQKYQYTFALGGREYKGVTGFNIASPAIGGRILDSEFEWYFTLVIIVTVVTILCINLLRSRVGRAWIAIRDNDIAASALGVNLGFYKLLAFAFSSALVAFQGALAAYHSNYVGVEEYTLWLSFTYLVMIIVGGAGSIMGSILGAFLITLLPYGLDALLNLFALPAALSSRLYAINYAIFGILAVIFLLVEREGLVGIWLRIRRFFEFWPFKHVRAISTSVRR